VLISKYNYICIYSNPQRYPHHGLEICASKIRTTIDHEQSLFCVQLIALALPDKSRTNPGSSRHDYTKITPR